MQSEAADTKEIGEPHNRRQHAAIRVAASERDCFFPDAGQTDVEFDGEIGQRRARDRINAGSNDKAGIEQAVCQ